MKLLSLLPILSLGQKTEECDKKCKSAINRQFRSETTNLAWKLLFDSGESNINKVISPLSILSSIYMLGAGAGGETRDLLLSALVDLENSPNQNVRNMSKEEFFGRFFEMEAFLSNESNQYTLDIANGVFANNDMLLESYEQTLEEYFINDPVTIVDFAQDSANATDLINQWISERTQGKIPEMYPEPVDQNTLIMLVSSLYFKGSWANTFIPMSEVKVQFKDYFRKKKVKLNLGWARASLSMLAIALQQYWNLQWRRSIYDSLGLGAFRSYR